jgi:hypothetical protein
MSFAPCTSPSCTPSLSTDLALQEEDPERALIAVPVVVVPGAHGEILRPVAVEVAERGERAEVIAWIEVASETARRLTDLSLGGDGAHPFRRKDSF